MSLTSVELNYLVWRYLQESGFELAAYAFERNSRCLDYAHPLNKVIDILQPGSLPNLVQKGILYSLLEETAGDKSRLLSLVEALLIDQKALEADNNSLLLDLNKAPQFGSTATIELSANGDSPEKEPVEDAKMNDVSFTTQLLKPVVTCPSSLAASWHPTTSVVALGMGELSAVIHAISSSGIAESALLNHPPLIDGSSTTPDPISLVAWDPHGTMLITSGANGEMRVWSPDGRLKNVANSLTDNERSPAALSSLVWNHRGLLALTVDVGNVFRLWDGVTFTLIYELRNADLQLDICACWLGEKKFAVSTSRDTIKIYSVGTAGSASMSADDITVMCVGQLAGHAHQITNLSFGGILRLLASLSDVDYSIKIWNSQLSQDAIEVNISSEKAAYMHYHTTPVIGLHWLDRSGDVQGSELLSVSMDGSVNVWDAFTGDSLLSANVFLNPDNFQFSEDQEPELLTKNSLIFAAAVSPNGKFLALGDDSGTVSVWDVVVSKYTEQKDLLRCFGVFAPASGAEAGICEISWDSSGTYISVCYQDTESAVLPWQVNN